MKYETTYEHNVAAWMKFVSRWRWGYKKLTIMSTISRTERNVGAVPNYVYLLFVLSKWKIGTQWIHVSTAVDPKLDVGRFIACIRLLVLQDQNDSLQRRANSQFAGKQFACRFILVGRVTLKSSLPKRRIYSSGTVVTTSRWELSDSKFHRQNWQIPLTQT